MSERVVKMLEQLQSDAVMRLASGKFATTIEFYFYRSAVEDMLVMLRSCPSEASDEAWRMADLLHKELHTGGSGSETPYSIAQRAVLAYKAVERDARRWQIHEFLMLQNGHSVREIQECREIIDAALAKRDAAMRQSTGEGKE